jgi:hypothetical protein
MPNDPAFSGEARSRLGNTTRKLGALTPWRYSELKVAGFDRCNALVGRLSREPGAQHGTDGRVAAPLIK